MSAAPARAHGIDGTWVKPDWPPLTLDEVRPILARFPHGIAPTRILTVSPRPFSAASVVATRHGRVFVKRHARSVRDREGLLEEHRFLAHLLARGAAVPRVLANGTAKPLSNLANGPMKFIRLRSASTFIAKRSRGLPFLKPPMPMPPV